MKTLRAVSIQSAFNKLTYLPNRTMDTTDAESANAFSELFSYRDGGIFIGHYAGNSQWERHNNGDEIVVAIDGQTTLFLIIDDEECSCELHAGEMIIVPANTWHRFESPKGLKVLTVTPQPTDHIKESPIG